MHTKYPFEPIKIYATKQEFDQCNYCLSLVYITEIGESQEIMEIVQNEYLINLHDVSGTNIERGHMDPKFSTSNTHLTVMFII
jgi:hypothetical protein